MSTTQLRQEEVVVKGSLKCEDCGNQAKKDCAYTRCRSCCKNKGFQCQTHIRSTWIPVDRRRRQRSMDHQPPPPPTTNQGGDIPKRHKQNPYSSLEELRFPAVTSSMATLSCVRVRSMDETVNEIAYQTSVKIGGHVFGGLLYHQGPAEQQQQQSFNNIIAASARGESSNIIDHPLDQQHNNLNLFSTSIHTRDGAGAGAGATMAPPLSSHEFFFPPLPHPFRPGMPYFSHSKP